MNKVLLKRQRILANLSKGRVLDIGFALDPNPYLNGAVGLDLDFKKCPENYSKCYKGDAVCFTKKIKMKFDTIIAAELIEHIEDPTKFLKECRKALKKKWVIVINNS